MGATWAVCRALLRLAHALDDCREPEWRETEVRQPVFILTAPRSGTTRLQRLLALDRERFTSMRLYQTVFPSVSVYRLIGWLRGVDRGVLRRALEHFDERLFPGFQRVHRLGLSEPEEDEALFVYSLLSPTLMMLVPFIDELGGRDVDALEPGDRARVMDFYRSCLQRHLHSEGPGRTMLVKNVWCAGRLQSMLETFPDAKVIYLARHPYEAVGSAVSMFSMPWRRLFPDRPTDGPEFRAFGRMIMRYQKAYAELQAQLPSDRFAAVRFDDLCTDPKASVEGIYRQFGWNVTPQMRARLEQETCEQRHFASKHTYSLEQFGLSKAEVYAELYDLFDRYGFAA